MLKALELSGFKSFADKTRFEFPPGITVVVGPNGSGKSNIVDAIKWVLGEQSAKSLRGKEMSDVIFKGSGGTNGRRPSNSAQATLVLENVERRLSIDADEVHISRRVYRSGETEYLINGETSRLKDIKNLIRGTGVGTDAYSLIEQGKVERMLSTSPKERRAIFEEAAGISRFKAKKIEAERRLSRVEGNLIRLADIVEEVGSRYRSVKAQASKAARYKEYSDRLKELRTTVGMKDWIETSEQLAELQTAKDEQQQQRDALDEVVTKQVTDTKDVESRLDEISGLFTQKQEQSTSIREQLAQNESMLQINQSRLTDIDQRKSDFEEQKVRAEKRTTELQGRIGKSEKELEDAEIKFRDAADQLAQLETEQTTLDESILSLKSNSETRRSTYLTLMAAVTEIGRLVSTADSQLQNGNKEKLRLDSLVAKYSEDLEANRSTYHRHQTEQERLKKEAESTDGALAEARKSFEQYRSELEGRKERLGELKTQQAGLTQRAKVIQELEKSLEGVNAGAKELLTKASKSKEGYLREIVGLVADLVSVNVQHAGIVDVALGELAQYIVIDGHELVDLLAAEQLKLNGRVGLIQITSPPMLGADPNVDLNGAAGIIGRADRLVQVEPIYVDFVRKLLGGTWVVKTLDDAMKLHQGSGRNARLVTLDGEIVEPDGTVIAGPKSVTSGLVSRRSELRALKRELEKLETEIETCHNQVKELSELESTAEEQVQRLISENSELTFELTQQTNQADSALAQIRKLEQELDETQGELSVTVSQLGDVNHQLTSDRQRLVANEMEVATINQLISSEEAKASETQTNRNAVERELTKAKVASAKREQQLEDLQSRLAQYRAEFEEHQQSTNELMERFEDDISSRQIAAEVIETATAKLNELSTEKDLVADELEKVSKERTEIDTKRRELSIELTAKRDEQRLVSDKLSQSQLRIEQITMQREQLAERMQEDYGIDISTLDYVPSEEEIAEREQVDAEIVTLRKKLGKIGSVNLDALTELEELEARYNHMDGQYQDLVEAKETLEKIIVRINADSRKLFVETLEAIRQNFQKLFRQTFGGGQADILLEEGVDPLDAGVEIIATPPGKPQFNNSLLSGGEKALTAVSLLMAIFQFRPSPFCVLDEVDAPFDEANIGRFIDVLKSFLGWTKFVIVTHSKKTMTAATTLYGITMQESGISKRVSVRFEDVSEDGEISKDAIERAGEDAA